MKILAIDTSSEACVVALQVDDLRDSQQLLSGRSHSRDILPSVVDLLARNKLQVGDLDVLVFGQGPGSFTGLRIAVGVVQGLGFGLDLPVVPVSSLACLALAAQRESGIDRQLVAMHARKQEVYLGLYQKAEDLVVLVEPERVVDLDEYRLPLESDWVGVGSGWDVLSDELRAAFNVSPQTILGTSIPHPDSLLDLGLDGLAKGRSVPAHEAQPQYLREQVASVPARS